MGFLGFGKKKDFVDLGERYKKQQERAENILADARENASDRSEDSSPSVAGFDFLGSLASSISGKTNSESSEEEYVDVSSGMNDRKKRLAKRIADMTSKMEDLSNQVYHLQQRVELLERKNNIHN